MPMKMALPPPPTMPAPARAWRALPLAAATGTALLTAALLTGCATPPAADVVTSPRPIGLKLQYPPRAQWSDSIGVVRLRVAYDATGTVLDVRIVQSAGHQALDAEALRAARAMRVQPGTRNGVPEAGVMVTQIRFQLE